MSAISLGTPGQDTGKWYCSQAAEKSVQVDTGRGLLWSLVICNLNAATRYFYVFDNTSAAGTVLAGPFAVAAGDTRGIDCRYGIQYETGLRVAASSTFGTFTDSGANDARYTVGYKRNIKRKDQTS